MKTRRRDHGAGRPRTTGWAVLHGNSNGILATSFLHFSFSRFPPLFARSMVEAEEVGEVASRGRLAREHGWRATHKRNGHGTEMRRLIEIAVINIGFKPRRESQWGICGWAPILLRPAPCRVCSFGIRPCDCSGTLHEANARSSHAGNMGRHVPAASYQPIR